MGIFNFRKKRNPDKASRCNCDNREDAFDNGAFAAKHRDALTKCLNDVHVCKLLGVDNIFTASDIRVPDLSKEDYLHIISHLFTLYLVIGNAEKSYTGKFDSEYRGVLREYIASNPRDEAIKQKLQAFFSMKEMISHFEAALATTQKVTDIKMNEYHKDGGKKEIVDFILLTQSQLDVSLGIMMLTNAYSGIDFIA